MSELSAGVRVYYYLTYVLSLVMGDSSILNAGAGGRGGCPVAHEKAEGRNNESSGCPASNGLNPNNMVGRA